MDNKTFIEFGFRIIWRIRQIYSNSPGLFHDLEFVNRTKDFMLSLIVPVINWVPLPWRDWDCLPLERNFVFLFFGEIKLQFFSPKKTEHIESYHLIRSFGHRCFLGHKLQNTNFESKSKTQDDQNLNRFSPRELQLCCKKSVKNSDENKIAVAS